MGSGNREALAFLEKLCALEQKSANKRHVT